MWDTYQMYNHDKLEIVQRRTARFVKSKHKRTESVTAMLDEHLSKKREDVSLILFYKIINKGLWGYPEERHL